MLTGRHPWPDFDNQMTAIFHIGHKGAGGPPRPKGCSEQALDFLNLCFLDVNERPSASELLQHEWLK